MLLNVANNRDHALDGVVENATWSTGRMSGKHALLFQNPNDCVRLKLPQSTADLNAGHMGLFRRPGLGVPRCKRFTDECGPRCACWSLCGKCGIGTGL